MAAVLAQGTTRLHNAAREPEVVDLCRFLVSLGARIEGEGTSTITVHGVPRLSPAGRPYRIVADRIEAGTYLCAAAITGGDVTVTGVDPELLDATLAKLADAGATVETTADSVRVRRTGALKAFRLRTEPFPGFPTDMQAQLMALACVADGTTTIEETIFENRYMHAAELVRLGADIVHAGRIATIKGKPRLEGASVMASDLRASAALVLAALAANGLTEVLRIYHLDRGYEDFVGKLRGVGARIARVSDALHDRGKMAAALDAPLVGQNPTAEA
jgi:UDP-N-acetylglucosamine 1-carboxyvinyltransferase